MSESWGTDDDRSNLAAFTFEQFGNYLLHMQRLSYDKWLSVRSQCLFDIYPETGQTAFEVKSASNNDQIKIRVDQLERQLAELGVLYKYGATLLFSYKNCVKKNGRVQRLFRKKGRTPKRGRKFLLKSELVVYAVDLRIFDALRKINGTRPRRRDMFDDKQLVCINREQLRNIADAPRASMANLGFSEEEIARWLPPKAKHLRPRRVTGKMDRISFNFKLVPLMPNASKVQMLKQMNGSVKKI